MTFKEDLSGYIQASYASLYITTHEESRITGEVCDWFKEEYKIYVWDSIIGLYEKLEGTKRKVIKDTIEPVAMLAHIAANCQSGQGSEHIYILKDFHLQLE